MLLKVHEDRPVAVALLFGPIVDPEHPHPVGAATGGLTNALQQRVGADEQPQLAGKASPRFAAELESDQKKRFVQAIGLAGVDRNLRQPLTEDRPLALRVYAEESPRLDLERHADVAP